MKKMICLVLALIMVLSITTFASAAELSDGNAKAKAAKVEQGNVVTTDIILWDDGNYICFTKEIEASDEGSEGMIPYATTISKSFEHTITDRNGIFVATFTTEVRGAYTSTFAMITSVTGTYSDAAVSGLSYSVDYNESTATVYIKINGATIGSLGYKINTYGTISMI